ncbi:hypothetical protein TTHERM_01050680 (macronuclear) [Tetrahymena thermophila SB210]|uniref:Uncharacterized protein n=1 Tax=Tetrahymena thermophila (strain SB210) TaxID=312017 RepID=Q22XI8_TETTS|nr:hypothetical protein TTHERM_01050680 [Tetrahymena thermophila SB210]EAR90022.2 hypothetical protein TTHERM_01050680 [Tetrahymena thermophila SB210]|eukprot:XP_001010267.2 hypothetical protein TTHERM_01050680 [Tetrahymena thermophila SB210]
MQIVMSNHTNFVDQIGVIKEELNSQEFLSIESEAISKSKVRSEILSNKIKQIIIDQNAICIQEFSSKQPQLKQTENMNQQANLSNIPDNVSFGRLSPQNEHRQINLPLAKVSQINFDGIPFPTKFIVSKALMNPIPPPQLNLQKLAQIQQFQQPIKSSKLNEFPIIKECQVPRKRGSLTYRNIDEDLNIFQQKTNQADINQQNGNSSNINVLNNSSPISQLKRSAYRIKHDLNNSCFANDFTESYNKISYKRMSDFGQNQQNARSQISSLQQKKEIQDNNINKINLQNNQIGNKFGKPILNMQHPLLQIAQQQGIAKNNYDLSQQQKQGNNNNSCNSSRVFANKKSSLINNRSLRNSPRAFDLYDKEYEYSKVNENNFSVQQKERTPLVQLINQQSNLIDIDCNLENELNISNRQHLKHLDQKSIAKKIHVYKKYINKLEDLLQECQQEDQKKILPDQKYKTNNTNPPSSHFQIESQIFKQNRSIFFEKVRPTTSSVTVSRNNPQSKNSNLIEGFNQLAESALVANTASISNPTYISNSVFVSNSGLKNIPNPEFIVPKNSVLLHGLDLERNEINFNQKQPYQILQKLQHIPLKNTENAIENIIQQRSNLRKDLNNSVVGIASPFEENNSRLNKSIDFIYTNKSKSSNKLEKKPLNQGVKVNEIQKKTPYIFEQIRTARQQIGNTTDHIQPKQTSTKNGSVQDRNSQNEQQQQYMTYRKKSFLDKTASFAMYS